jgi:hypothetical protein
METSASMLLNVNFPFVMLLAILNVVPVHSRRMCGTIKLPTMGLLQFGQTTYEMSFSTASLTFNSSISCQVVLVSVEPIGLNQHDVRRHEPFELQFGLKPAWPAKRNDHIGIELLLF